MSNPLRPQLVGVAGSGSRLWSGMGWAFLKIEESFDEFRKEMFY